MSGPIQEYTINYQLEIPAFDFPAWHTYYARTLRTIDALFVLSTGITNVRGPWANGKNYVLGDIAVDMSVATAPNIWQCLVPHTSPLTGSFLDSRTANPSYWQARLSLPQFRGTWATPVNYFVGDFVVSANQFAIAKTNHTSGATFAGDIAANWTVLIDLGTSTGTGAIVRATSPTIITPALSSPILTTPALGTPASGVLTNCTGLPLTSGATGVLPIANGGTNGSAASGTLLDNITGFGATGILVRTAAGTYAFRTLGAGTGISIANADGVAGAPSISITDVIVAGGPTGNATTVPVLTWNAKGQLTAVTTAPTGVTANGTAAIGQLPGIGSNTPPNSTAVGEVISSAVGTTVGMANTVPINMTSISLPAGDWDVWGNVITTGPAATTVSNVEASISLTSNTMDFTDSTRWGQQIFFNLAIYNPANYNTTGTNVPVGAVRLLLNATTTVYLVGASTFATSTTTGGGTIFARRRR